MNLVAYCTLVEGEYSQLAGLGSLLTHDGAGAFSLELHHTGTEICSLTLGHVLSLAVIVLMNAVCSPYALISSMALRPSHGTSTSLRILAPFARWLSLSWRADILHVRLSFYQTDTLH